MRQRRKKFLAWALSLLIMLFVVAALGAGYFLVALFSPASDSTETVSFLVVEGQGANAISQSLHEAGLIKSKLVFETYLWAKGLEESMIAGEYDLPAGVTVAGLARRLTSGPDEPLDRKVTIIEGWTNAQVASYLEEEGAASSAEFLSLAGPSRPERINERFPFLSDIPAGVDAEGYFFPDTYRIFLDASTEDIILKMLDNFEAKVDGEILEEISRQEKTLHEVLTLASIIEAEVRTSEDRRQVSDIFLKRLAVGMPLQSDATVNYVTGSGRARSTHEDLGVESRYNTYKYPGLPPGPINNPSLDSIKAALYPTPNPYYYFLTDPAGGVHYARSGDEHNENRARYLD